MGKVTFGMMTSLDGYINDREGGFDWGHVSEDVHRFAETEQKREGLAIYGRRMYETMVYWDTADQDESLAPYFRDFSRVWQAVDKIVVSKSLEKVTSKRTRLVRELSADDIRRLKADTEKNISISGPTLAASFLKQGLIDEVSIYYVPVVVGGGTPMFQDVWKTLKLERLDHRAFDNGLLFVRYRVLN
ncbi:dihydrofolate reductase family protein [Cystobacter ferrugineus]|uniref:Riboflavin biosynthesis protein RibD n=1 Tax=Cystobacter ferrugineus TaxID=83449 RepID=A0A1L9AUH7_9BACT|nr:dihydrofolate reductase family protein [Cystobacter ferrugineus]OJH33659.1 riboflavin biosynthesis protein RibD [Cystobacter ferrugineus]